ncbi:MAG: ribokinase [Rhodothermaeota bacterium MED-G19]|nr:MAG: ribokinase [Rhodothermaeota bacterium MED-G19]
MKILNFGSINKDLVYNVEDFVKPGETISSRDYGLYLGGKGLNQSVAISKSGSEVYHAGCINKSDHSIISDLKKWGVNTDYINKIDEATGHAIIQINQDGENSIIIHGGANNCVEKDQIDMVLSNFNEGDYILLQNEINSVNEIIEKAHKKGLRIFFNPAPYSSAVNNYSIEKVNTLIYNETEGQRLSGKKDYNQIIKTLSNKYPNTRQILTLGERGSIYSFDKNTIKVKAESVKTIDSTAAGDTYIGYYISSLSKKVSVKQSMKIASQAASIATTIVGGANSIPEIN